MCLLNVSLFKIFASIHLKARRYSKRNLVDFYLEEKFVDLARKVCSKLMHLLENVAILLPFYLESLFFWF